MKKSKKDRVIYGLYDPRNMELRYIGKSESGPNSRLCRHLTPSVLQIEKTHKNNWIKSLLKLNIRPIIKVLHHCSEVENLSLLEIQYIKYYKDIGVNLTNQTDGGDGMAGYIPSLNTRSLISKKRSGTKASDVTKLKMSNAHSGKNHHFNGKTLSKDHIAKISRSLIGKSLGITRSIEFKNSVAKGRGSRSFTVFKKSLKIKSFVSLREASKALLICRKKIKYALRNQLEYSGYIFKYD